MDFRIAGTFTDSLAKPHAIGVFVRSADELDRARAATETGTLQGE